MGNDLTPCFANSCDDMREDTILDKTYLIPPRGDEQKSIKTDNNASYESGSVKGWPEKWPDSTKTPQISPELQQIITAWPELSVEQKQAILDIINKRK